MKIKLHPFFIAAAAVLIILNGFELFFFSLAAVLAHEFAHAFAARGRGYPSGSIILLPYGAVLYNKHNLDKTSNLIIAVAGPLSNFLISLITVSFWWIFPESYAVTKNFVSCNMIIGLFNLLPVYPFDGARVILALTNYNLRALKALKLCSVIISVALMAAFIATAFDKINFSFLFISIFLFFGGISNTDKEVFSRMLTESPIIKDYENGVTKTTVLLDKSVTLKRVLRMIKPNRLLTVIVIENGKQTATLEEPDLRELIYKNPLNKTLYEAINNR